MDQCAIGGVIVASNLTIGVPQLRAFFYPLINFHDATRRRIGLCGLSVPAVTLRPSDSIALATWRQPRSENLLSASKQAPSAKSGARSPGVGTVGLDAFYTLRGRLCPAADHWLFFVTGGLAVTREKFSQSINFINQQQQITLPITGPPAVLTLAAPQRQRQAGRLAAVLNTPRTSNGRSRASTSTSI